MNRLILFLILFTILCFNLFQNDALGYTIQAENMRGETNSGCRQVSSENVSPTDNKINVIMEVKPNWAALGVGLKIDGKDNRLSLSLVKPGQWTTITERFSITEKNVHKIEVCIWQKSGSGSELKNIEINNLKITGYRLGPPIPKDNLQSTNDSCNAKVPSSLIQYTPKGNIENSFSLKITSNPNSCEYNVVAIDSDGFKILLSSTVVKNASIDVSRLSNGNYLFQLYYDDIPVSEKLPIYVRHNLIINNNSENENVNKNNQNNDLSKISNRETNSLDVDNTLLFLAIPIIAIVIVAAIILSKRKNQYSSKPKPEPEPEPTPEPENDQVDGKRRELYLIIDNSNYYSKEAKRISSEIKKISNESGEFESVSKKASELFIQIRDYTREVEDLVEDTQLQINKIKKHVFVLKNIQSLRELGIIENDIEQILNTIKNYKIQMEGLLTKAKNNYDKIIREKPDKRPSKEPPKGSGKSTPKSPDSEESRILNSTDAYEVLGITTSATEQEIKKRWRELRRKYDAVKDRENKSPQEIEKLENISMKINWARDQINGK